MPSKLALAAAVCIFSSVGACLAWGQDQVQPSPNAAADGIDAMPILRLEAGAPTSFVSSLAFNQQTGTLYAGSWDKVVRTWAFDESKGQFTTNPAATYRIPVGPGLDGAINAVAVSPDGKWLAVAGLSVMRGASDLRHDGWVIPSASPTVEMLEDRGTIYLFDTRSGKVRVLKGHRGAVVTLTFAAGDPRRPPILLSLGEEAMPGKTNAEASVRAWDVAAAWQNQPQPYLGGLMLPAIVTKPSLAAWYSGPAAKQVRVAIGAGDSVLRIWDLATNKTTKNNVAAFSNLVSWWGDGGRLITGHASRLNLWNVGNTAATSSQTVPLQNGDIPLDVALFASERTGRADHAAVAVQNAGVHFVRVVNLNSRQLVPNTGELLWSLDDGGLPILVASPTSRMLAVAGQANHDILTLPMDRLLQGRAEVSKLRGDGMTAASASFVKRDNSLGLLISPATAQEPGPAARGKLVFDPVNRTVTTNVAPWDAAAADTSGWRVEAGSKGENAAKRWFFNVYEPQSDRRTFLLPPRRFDVTAYALLPPRAPLNVPLLAVASRLFGGSPQLEVYDLSAGDAFGTAVRHLSGHADWINSLAFSEDGKLLVTASRDRTICVWNMDDLDRVVGQRGTISDVRFTFDEGHHRLIVNNVQDAGPNASRLAAGDVILGWAEGANVAPLESLAAFYLRLSSLKPGERTPALGVRRGGQTLPNVELVVGQGADERKPLFTLFIRDEQPWEWIGWSPLGPYESSAKTVEQLVGWHFNLALADAKRERTLTRFAAIGEYENLYRQGLIEHMLSDRKLPVVKPQALSRPEMNLRLKPREGDVVDYADRDDTIRFSKGAELELELSELTPELVHDVALQLAGGVQVPFQATSLHAWTANLDALPRQRTPALRGTLVVTTREIRPQTFSKSLAFAYRGQSPVIEIDEPSEPLTTTDQSTLRLKGRIRLPEDGQSAVKVDVTLGSSGAAKPVAVPEPVVAAGVATMDVADIELQPGENVLSIVAANPEDPAERSVLVRRVQFTPAEAVAPPRLFVRAVSPETGLARELTSERDEPLTVDTPELRLEGRIAADEPLVEAKWGLNGADTDFTGFMPPAVAPFNVHETSITLEPGSQQLRCLAKTAGSLPAQASLTVVYVPPASQPLIVEPQAERDLERYEGRDSRLTPVRIRLEPADDKQDLTVLLNGNALDEKPTLDAASGTYQANVNLEETETGENHIAVRTTNPWGAVKTSSEVVIRFLRAPQIVNFECPAQVDSPVLSCSFEVVSPQGMDLKELEVNGWVLPPDAAQLDPENGHWKVRATGIPLREGVNSVTPRSQRARLVGGHRDQGRDADAAAAAQGDDHV